MGLCHCHRICADKFKHNEWEGQQNFVVGGPYYLEPAVVRDFESTATSSIVSAVVKPGGL
jgi:hypothetical protein